MGLPSCMFSVDSCLRGNDGRFCKGRIKEELDKIHRCGGAALHLGVHALHGLMSLG